MSSITQWRFVGSTAELASGVGVTLRNLKREAISEQASLRFGKREDGIGIELDWDDPMDLGNVTVTSQQAGGGPIAFATPVAIHVEGGGFLGYAARDTGIDLIWSATPQFEWEITGGLPGTPVPLNAPVALLNTTHGDHLVYDDAVFGINLSWYADFHIFARAQPNRKFFAKYLPLPIPNSLRAPGHEAAQIQITGVARKVTLYHGRVDDELDWHVYAALDPAERHTLAAHLREHARGGGGVSESDLDELYCELMVCDGRRNTLFDEFFRSADVTRAFELTMPAWDISVVAGDHQADDVEVTDHSGLTLSETRIAMQGPFVNDTAHGFLLEIHPLDSIAYAREVSGTPIAVTADDPQWPEQDVIWRVAAFTNSTYHRIHRADYLRQERTIVWLLDLPRADRSTGTLPHHGTGGPLTQTVVGVTEPGFTNRALDADDLDAARPTAATIYDRYGVISVDHALTPRGPDGRRLLRVVISMAKPDRWGGMFLADFHIQVRPPIIGPVGTD